MERKGQEDTKLRLLEAAGEVFSRKGFHHATVREICRLAGANVAAVNYHFGDKARLYQSLLHYSFEAGLRRYPPDFGLGPDPTPEDRLRAFVHSFLLRLMGEGRPAWHGKLMAREMFEPTEALEQVVRKSIMPLSKILQGIIRDLMGRDPDPEAVRLCAFSIAGQCQFCYRARAIASQVYPEITPDRDGLSRLVRHICRFSLAAVRNYAPTFPQESAP